MNEGRIIRSGNGVTLVILNGDMNDIKRVKKSTENSGVLIHAVGKTVKTWNKKHEVGFLVMLLGTLGASVLGSMLPGKRVIRAGRGYNNMDHIDKTC